MKSVDDGIETLLQLPAVICRQYYSTRRRDEAEDE